SSPTAPGSKPARTWMPRAALAVAVAVAVAVAAAIGLLVLLGLATGLGRQSAPSWQTLRTFSGHYSSDVPPLRPTPTETVTVPTERWRLVVQCNLGGEEAVGLNFRPSVRVVVEGVSLTRDAPVCYPEPTGSVTAEERGRGEHSFVIAATNCASCSWTI